MLETQLVLVHGYQIVFQWSQAAQFTTFFAGTKTVLFLILCLLNTANPQKKKNRMLFYYVIYPFIMLQFIHSL